MEQIEQILTPQAIAFLNKLHATFNARRLELLNNRQKRQTVLDAGVLPNFLEETKKIREDRSWKVAPPPKDLQKRYVEITGPVEKKMMINALNSGANCFMADFEDSLSPTFENVVDGQLNLMAAVDHTLTYTSPEGKAYQLNEKNAVLLVRPRGWHLVEKHYAMPDGVQISASIFDAGLYFFHNAQKLVAKGTGPYFYLPKLESHLEARLWNDIFVMMEDEFGFAKGTIRATVLIETILAAFEMEEILYELKDYCVGLNAGRWDYIFSIIKKFQKKEGFALPDRSQVTMTVPFMRAYTDLLINTCHKRGAHAMGGMSAFIPSRKDPHVNRIALEKVIEDKVRESRDGFDGTWVAHPDLVPVAMKVFTEALQGRPDQKDRMREKVENHQLLNFKISDASVTAEGLRQNIRVCLQYIESWLRGQGAVQISNLMEDAATAEIARAELWLWINRGLVDIDQYTKIANEEHDRLAAPNRLFELAYQIIDGLVINPRCEDFFTLSAYRYLK